jgi:hypothetical protein
MLARATSIAKNRNMNLGIAPGLIARRYVFERGAFRTSPKFATVNLSTSCMFVVALIDDLRPSRM